MSPGDLRQGSFRVLEAHGFGEDHARGNLHAGGEQAQAGGCGGFRQRRQIDAPTYVTAELPVGVQTDPAAPFVPVADYNIMADRRSSQGRCSKNSPADASSNASPLGSCDTT